MEKEGEVSLNHRMWHSLCPLPICSMNVKNGECSASLKTADWLVPSMSGCSAHCGVFAAKTTTSQQLWSEADREWKVLEPRFDLQSIGPIRVLTVTVKRNVTLEQRLLPASPLGETTDGATQEYFLSPADTKSQPFLTFYKPQATNQLTFSSALDIHKINAKRWNSYWDRKNRTELSFSIVNLSLLEWLHTYNFAQIPFML